MRRSVIFLCVAVAAFVSAQNEHRAPRQFWMGFERGFNQARTEVQRTVEDNIMTALGRVQSLGHRIGALAGDSKKETEVPSDSKKQTITDVVRSEAYEGLDDGLMPGPVRYEGDAETERIAQKERIPLPTVDVVPQTPSRPSIFDFNFGFNSRFPFVLGPSRIPSIFTKRADLQPWWKKENVCVTTAQENEAIEELEQPALEAEVGASDGGKESVPSEGAEERGRGLFFGHMTVHSCSEQNDKVTCTTKVSRRGVKTVTSKTYRCCHGFVREGNVCARVDTLPLPEALEQLGRKNFLSLAVSSVTLDDVDGRNLTIFAPSDEAILDYMATNENEKNDLDSLDRRYMRTLNDDELPALRERMNLHFHEGLLYSGDFVDEQVVPSLSPQSGLRLNVYPQVTPPLVTANCAPLRSADHHFAEGIIHTLDRVIPPATHTIAQIIESDPQFSYLSILLNAGGEMLQLEQEGQFTLFAPTNEAFEEIDDLEAFLTNAGCVPAIAKNHILPNVVCGTAITQTANARGRTIVNSLLDVSLHVHHSEANGTTVGLRTATKAQIVKMDIMASNGVIHAINRVIVPRQGSSTHTLLGLLGQTRFLDLIKKAGLDEEVEADNVTVLGPTNAAFDAYPDMENIEKDPERLRALLSYHIVKTAFTLDNSFNNQQLETYSGVPLRINYFKGPPVINLETIFQGPLALMRVTASCSPLSNRGSHACGGKIVREIDQVLRPPAENLMERLKELPELSIFLSLVEDYEDKAILEGPGPLTILAPSDHVFKTLPEEELKEIREDPIIRKEIVERHIVKDFMCCSGIPPNTFPLATKEATTLHGNALTIERTSGRYKVGASRITKCNSPGSNGLVHVVDELFVEPHVPDTRYAWDDKNPMILRVPVFSREWF